MLKVLLIAGSNWNNGTNTGVSYRNANNWKMFDFTIRDK
jgi:hypothetical protein